MQQCRTQVSNEDMNVSHNNDISPKDLIRQNKTFDLLLGFFNYKPR